MPGLQNAQIGIFAVALIDRPAVMPRNKAFQGSGVQNTLAPFSAIIAPIGKIVFWQRGHIGQKDLPTELPPFQ